MKKLSTGQNSTLGVYRDLSEIVFGEDSKQVEWLDKKIAESTIGEEEEVLVDERQLIHFLMTLNEPKKT